MTIKTSDMKRICTSVLLLAVCLVSGAQDYMKSREEIMKVWRSAKAAELREIDENSEISINGDTLKYTFTVFGARPEGGRSLWISLHGGGGTTAQMNDSQWENQKKLYRPSEGIYLCPRAPWNTWDMWFQAPIDDLFEKLIETMVVLHDVNPDRVYIMGYSAGGDGVWRLAPRMADHWASAAMMAGHPGDVSLMNVRNMPFTIWVGENDGTYNRNREVAARGKELDKLQTDDPEGYVHDWHVVEGKGHWMELRDSVALPWMAQYIRNPYPTKIVWRQEEVGRTMFYWLKVPENEAVKGKKLCLEVKGNTINISECDYTSLTIYLNDKILNLNKEVTVKYGEKTLFKGRLRRKAETLRKTLEERNDPSYMFDTELTVNL